MKKQTQKFRNLYLGDSNISPLLLMLVVMFVSVLIISNILANRMVQVWVFSIDAGTLTFPVTYILSDLFSEVYGYKWSRRVTRYATVMNIILALFIKLSCALPAPDYFDPTPFTVALNGSFRIVIASIVSFYLGDFVNDVVFKHLKKKHKDMTGFSARAVLSSVVGSIVDTTAFVFIAFLGEMPAIEMPKMIFISVLMKVGYEIIILPATYKITKFVKEQELKYI